MAPTPIKTSILSLFFLIALLPAQARADTFLKGGLIFSPSVADASDRWYFSFGKESPLNLRQTFFWGIELQGATYQTTIDLQTIQTIPLNGFLNLKAKADKFKRRPFAGIGLGMMTFFSDETGEMIWNRKAGIQLMLGVEWGPLTFELQSQRRFVEGDGFSFAGLAGLIW